MQHLARSCTQAPDDFPERSDSAEMKEQHGHQLLPATESLAVLLPLMFSYDAFKGREIDQVVYDLSEQTGSFVCHVMLRECGYCSLQTKHTISRSFLFAQMSHMISTNLADYRLRCRSGA